MPTIEDGVQQKAWLCGPPEHLIAQLKDIEAKYPGLEHIMLQWPEGMPLREFKRAVAPGRTRSDACVYRGYCRGWCWQDSVTLWSLASPT